MKADQSQLKTTIQSLATVVFVCVLLFLRNATLIAVAGAALFTIAFALRPEHFRSRSGSLNLAFCLLGFVWLCAAVPALLSLLGRTE
jgi:hypothetical protein